MTNAQIFSQYSDQYAKHRPQYPDELFAYLSSIASGHDAVWDCGTGNGQAAVTLAKYFSRVEATDISAEQIRHCIVHPQVRYNVSPAEHTSFENASFDLVAVATAAHWFDLPSFFLEVGRVLKPAGILAVWTYGLATVEPAIDEIIQRELLEPIDPFWAEGNRMVMNGYRDLSLPFNTLQPPEFSIRLEWTLSQASAYLRTWSAVKRYSDEVGTDPVERLAAKLTPLWGEAEQVQAVNMPIYLRVSRKGA